MERSKKIIIILLIFVLIIISSYIISSLRKTEKDSSNSPGLPVNITLENFEEIVSKNPMIQNLPKDAIIKLSFYEGNREENFLLRRGSVTRGNSTNLDMTISLPIKYLGDLTDRNFCEVINRAKNEGLLFTSTDKSTSSLLWKYRSMMEYRDCIGF
jgi:hypothetical protein